MPVLIQTTTTYYETIVITYGDPRSFLHDKHCAGGSKL